MEMCVLDKYRKQLQNCHPCLKNAFVTAAVLIIPRSLFLRQKS